MKRAPRSTIITLLLFFFAAVLLASSASDAVSPYVNYQGMLSDSEGTPLDGTFSMTFRIFDDPLSTSAADQLWEETQTNVDVQEGVYNVHLGSVTSFDTAQESKTGEFWLEVEVDGEILAPRQLITTVFFALNAEQAVEADMANDADNLDGRDSTDFLDMDTYDADRNARVDDADSTEYAPQAGNADTVDNVHADELQRRVSGVCPPGESIRAVELSGAVTCEEDDEGISDEEDPTVNTLGKASLPCAAGQVAKSDGANWGCASDDASSTTYSAGTGLALNGTVFSAELPFSLLDDSSFGVIRGTHSGSNTYGRLGEVGTGVHGNTARVGGIGVLGESDGTDGIGVKGESSSDSGMGIAGYATASTGETSGVYGKSDSTTFGRGVFGESVAVSGMTSGVLGYSYSTSGRGVYGLAHATTGVATGVRGQSSSTSGYGVWGVVNAASGETAGVRGQASSTSGYGVSGLATATSGSTVGVRGQSGSPDGTGVAGYSLATSGVSTGVRGETNSPSGYGVYGSAFGNSGTGVYGFTSFGKAGHFEGSGSGVPGAAVYAENFSTTGIAGFFQNNSDDATAVLVQQGTGDVLRGFYDTGSGWDYAIRVQRNGWTTISVLELTGGADLSEQFDVSGAADEAIPGMVVIIDPDNPGRLRVSGEAYDRKVAGIISGAGGVQPGMLMAQKGSEADGANPVALTGRVYCWADAAYGGIEPGDMLTTSNTPGHAMRVADHQQAQGAVIGKAMSPLAEGTGLVLVLVSLQ